MSISFDRAAGAIADLSRELHARGWVPATSGNFSLRLDGERIAITASGKDKSRLAASDVMQVDRTGQPIGPGRPSAETGLHLQLYRRDPAIGAVLHTHSINAVRASMQAGRFITWQGLELLKALPGIDSHETEWGLPVFDNDQDIDRLAHEVDRCMAALESEQHRPATGPAYLIRGHGLYVWGTDLDEARKHMEAVEYLLGYHLGIEPGGVP